MAPLNVERGDQARRRLRQTSPARGSKTIAGAPHTPPEDDAGGGVAVGRSALPGERGVFVGRGGTSVLLRAGKGVMVAVGGGVALSRDGVGVRVDVGNADGTGVGVAGR